MAINPPVVGPGIAGPFVTSFLDAMQRAKAAQEARRAGGLTGGLQAARLLEALRQRQVEGETFAATEKLLAGPEGGPVGAQAPSVSPTALTPAVGGVPQAPGEAPGEFGLDRPPVAESLLGGLTPRERALVLTEKPGPGVFKTLADAERERRELADRRESRRLQALALEEKDMLKRAEKLRQAYSLINTPEGARLADRELQFIKEFHEKEEQQALANEDRKNLDACNAEWEADPTPGTLVAAERCLDNVKSNYFITKRNEISAKTLERRFSPDAQENMAFLFIHREADAARAAGKEPDYGSMLSRMLPQHQRAFGSWFRKALLTGKALPREFYDVARVSPPAAGASKTDREAAYREVKAARPDLDENSLEFGALEGEAVNRILRARKEALVTPEEREYQALRRRVTEKQLGRGDYERLTLVRQRITQEMANIQRFGDPQGADAERYQFLQGEEAYVRAALPLARQAEEAAKKAAPKAKAVPKEPSGAFVPPKKPAAPPSTRPAPSGALIPPRKPAAVPPAPVAVPPVARAAPPGLLPAPAVSPAAAAKADAFIDAALKARGMTGKQFGDLPPEEQSRIIEEERRRIIEQRLSPAAGRIGTPGPAAPSAGLSAAAAAQRAGEREAQPIGKAIEPVRGQLGTPSPPVRAVPARPSPPPIAEVPPRAIPPETIEDEARLGIFDADLAELERERRARETPPSPTRPLRPTPKPRAGPKKPAPKAAERPIRAPSPDEIERYAYFQWISDNYPLEDSPKARERWERLSILDKGRYYKIAADVLKKQRRLELEQAR